MLRFIEIYYNEEDVFTGKKIRATAISTISEDEYNRIIKSIEEILKINGIKDYLGEITGIASVD